MEERVRTRIFQARGKTKKMKRLKSNKNVSETYHKYKISKYEYLIKQFEEYIKFHQNKLRKLKKK